MYRDEPPERVLRCQQLETRRTGWYSDTLDCPIRIARFRDQIQGDLTIMQPRHRNTRRFLLTLGVLLLLCGVAGASDWPRFRGPNGAGIAADKNVPVKWTTDNILWKTAIPGVGHSSPIVHAGRVYLQSSSTDGKERWLL